MPGCKQLLRECSGGPRRGLHVHVSTVCHLRRPLEITGSPRGPTAQKQHQPCKQNPLKCPSRPSSQGNCTINNWVQALTGWDRFSREEGCSEERHLLLLKSFCHLLLAVPKGKPLVRGCGEWDKGAGGQAGDSRVGFLGLCSRPQAGSSCFEKWE